MEGAADALSEKARLIATALGLDPSTPLGELMAHANRRTGLSMGAHMNDTQIKKAEALLSSTSAQGSSSDSSSTAASSPCRACGALVPKTATNGCCARCLHEIHQAERRGHDAISKSEEEQIDGMGGSGAHGYGELTTVGFRKLCARLKLKETDFFVDAGSGTGQLVLQAAREYGVRRSVGVELSPSRHRIAVASRQDTPRQLTQFVCGDCAAMRLWTNRGSTADDGVLVGATVVFTCSVMFSQELMSRLVCATPHPKHQWPPPLGCSHETWTACTGSMYRSEPLSSYSRLAAALPGGSRRIAWLLRRAPCRDVRDELDGAARRQELTAPRRPGLVRLHLHPRYDGRRIACPSGRRVAMDRGGGRPDGDVRVSCDGVSATRTRPATCRHRLTIAIKKICLNRAAVAHPRATEPTRSGPCTRLLGGTRTWAHTAQGHKPSPKPKRRGTRPWSTLTADGACAGPTHDTRGRPRPGCTPPPLAHARGCTPP